MSVPGSNAAERKPKLIVPWKCIFKALKKVLKHGEYHDLIHVMDSSGSIPQAGFQSAKQAAQVEKVLDEWIVRLDSMYVSTLDKCLTICAFGSFLMQMKRTYLKYINFILNWWGGPISAQGSRVGLIEYSTPTHPDPPIDIHLGQYNTLQANNFWIAQEPYNGGSTASAFALWLALYEFLFDHPSNNRKIIWMYTDGFSNGGSPLFPAWWLKSAGVKICVMAIGPLVNQMELDLIASDGCVCRFKDWKEYEAAAQSAMKKADKEIRKKAVK